tara:strand:- start:420 stop:596 length:177 start_codon:yes stop_codon:yes gene_type:complete
MASKPEAAMLEEGYLEMLTIAERKGLVDELMESQGFKPKGEVNRAWDNVVEIKRDQGS